MPWQCFDLTTTEEVQKSEQKLCNTQNMSVKQPCCINMINITVWRRTKGTRQERTGEDKRGQERSSL